MEEARNVDLPILKMRVVNVDDDPDDREMFCRAMGKVDPEIQCVQISSAEEAVQLFSKNPVGPEFIFMDINMPRMNGYECVREIYQYPSLKDTTIVMFSSTFNPRDQVDFGLLGVKYLLKTSNLALLAKSIKDLLQAKFSVEIPKM